MGIRSIWWIWRWLPRNVWRIRNASIWNVRRLRHGNVPPRTPWNAHRKEVDDSERGFYDTEDLSSVYPVLIFMC
ncbi:hypothetical protein L5515_007192 [Caenorhabditis briggsae]|uniref:Uncharacterized protein n=1 Tax=Caenorhabditis briggsae TaxID=6238 RepID=A0AAE9JKV9_CAEBR|nr:hypothetical protein L5515_007192 [Caenorhabditis briggsae]